MLRIRTSAVGSLALQSLVLGAFAPGAAGGAVQLPLDVGGSVRATRIIDGLRVLAYGVVVTPDAKWNANIVSATDGVAFTINSPFGAPPVLAGTSATFRLVIKNASGGVMGLVTFGALLHLADAFVNPANGFNRSLVFQWDGASWLEIGRSAADVAN